MHGVAIGLEYLHKNDIVHGNLETVIVTRCHTKAENRVCTYVTTHPAKHPGRQASRPVHLRFRVLANRRRGGFHDVRHRFNNAYRTRTIRSSRYGWGKYETQAFCSGDQELRRVFVRVFSFRGTYPVPLDSITPFPTAIALNSTRQILNPTPPPPKIGSPFVTPDGLDALRPNRSDYPLGTVSQELWFVLDQCWFVDPHQRPTMTEILASPAFGVAQRRESLTIPQLELKTSVSQLLVFFPLLD